MENVKVMEKIKLPICVNSAVNLKLLGLELKDNTRGYVFTKYLKSTLLLEFGYVESENELKESEGMVVNYRRGKKGEINYLKSTLREMGFINLENSNRYKHCNRLIKILKILGWPEIDGKGLTISKKLLR